ncbi:hypothetical protein BWI97_26600 [Siphonobacter sp. BAB-5405]|nr:hypothetical protein BWI97_26600 [Siphonobacter sp. BAB-5405]
MKSFTLQFHQSELESIQKIVKAKSTRIEKLSIRKYLLKAIYSQFRERPERAFREIGQTRTNHEKGMYLRAFFMGIVNSSSETSASHLVLNSKTITTNCMRFEKMPLRSINA